MENLTPESVLELIFKNQAYNPATFEQIKRNYPGTRIGASDSDLAAQLEKCLQELKRKEYMSSSNHEYTEADGRPMVLWQITQQGIDFLKERDEKLKKEIEKEELKRNGLMSVIKMHQLVEQSAEDSKQSLGIATDSRGIAKRSFWVNIVILIVTVLSLAIAFIGKK